MKEFNKAKKAILALMLCVVLILPMLPSCKNDADYDWAESPYSAKEIADAIIAAYDQSELPESGFEYFYSGADQDSDNYIDARFAGMLINGAYAPLDEYAYLADCALYVPIGNHVFEVDVLKVGESDKKNIGKMKKLLEKRLATKTNSDVLVYTPKDAPLIENAQVIAVGGFVILLATTDNGKAENAVNEMLK